MYEQLKPKVLFIGSHLSGVRGTKGISEKVIPLLEDSITPRLVSSYENQFLRMLDIIVAVSFYSYEIVHIDVFSGRGFYYARWASFLAKIRKKKIIMTLHGGNLPKIYAQQKMLFNDIFERADILQTPSRFLSCFFKEHGLEISYLPNFICQSQFPFRENNGKPFSILWVRAFSHEYHPEMAIQTVFRLKQKYPKVQMTMVGPDKGTLKDAKELIDKLNLEDHIEIIGSVPNENLHRYFHSHAVFLNTTAYESFGVAVLEAASCGTPIVSTRVGEIPHIWNENEEVLMVNKSSDEMAESVAKIFDSNKLSIKLSKAANKKASKYYWEKIRPQWLKLFA